MVLVPERPLSDDDPTKDVDAFQEVDSGENSRCCPGRRPTGDATSRLLEVDWRHRNRGPSWRWMECESLPPWFARTPRGIRMALLSFKGGRRS